MAMSLQDLTGVLVQALCQDQVNVKEAEAKLSSFEVQPGYHQALATVFRNAEIPEQVRWMALVCLKNGVNRYWRKNAPGAIADTEKAVIRDMLLQSLTTTLGQQLALQLALVIAKVSRYDFPGDWQAVVPHLMNHLDSPYGYQCSLALYHFIKSLTTKRILSDRYVFYDVSSRMFYPIVACWRATTQAFLAENVDVDLLQRSLLSLKSIKLLLVHGQKKGVEEKLAACFEDMFNWLLTMLKCRAFCGEREPYATLLTKWCLQCSKVFLEVQYQHTSAYIPYVKGSFSLAVQFAFNQEWRGVMFERCLVNTFNLLKSCITEPAYRGEQAEQAARETGVYEGRDLPDQVSGTDLVLEFFTDSMVAEFLQRLILDFFPVSQAELDEWQANPEEFAAEQGGDLWRYSIKPCTESLFVTLLRIFREVAEREVVSLVSQIQPLQVEPTFAEAQRRQATYTAVGLAPYMLYDHLDFDKWFLEFLIPELRVNHKNYLIVHRTILWMLSQWSDIKLSERHRPLLYETLAAFVEPDKDLVVRLAACQATKDVVDDFVFIADQFAPYLDFYMKAIFQLLTDLQDCQGKMVVLQTTTFIVERMGKRCDPFAERIVAFVPLLWTESSEHIMLRVAIISLLTRIIDNMQAVDASLFPTTLSIIAHSVNPDEPQQVFLLEEALDLWRAVLEAVREGDPETNFCLLELTRFILPIVEMGSDHLEAITGILKLHIVLFKMDFLQRYPEQLRDVLCSSFVELNITGCMLILKVVDMAIRVAPVESVKLFYPLIGYALEEIVEESHTREYTNVSFSIWCRVLLYAEVAAMDLLRDRAAAKQSTPEAQMRLVMDCWMKKMGNISVVQTQKLMAITLLRLLVDYWNWSDIMYKNVCAIALAVCELLNDITEVAEDGTQTDSLLIPADSPESVNAEVELDQSCHSARMFQIIKKDVAHTIVLSDFLLHQMRALAEKVGPQKFEEVLQEIDCETRDMLESYTKTGMFARNKYTC
ncbi:importin-11 [Galendromus occidentalis]|uniref:Importin-11 n=1 Tax=Galendromus occidentalis TaxID=34638 RepID=A0AAJ6QUK6_9ACAR|nr:importin-11 [Galendromus occidentalis]